MSGNEGRQQVRGSRSRPVRRHSLLIEPLEERSLLSFAAPLAFDAGETPVAVVTGDFNHDGLADLATANRGSRDVTVLLNDGNGQFEPPRRTALGGTPTLLVVGDFNRDGREDLAATVVANDYLNVLLGDGDGTFPTVVSSRLGFARPLGLVMGDYDRDGQLDLATADLVYVGVYTGRGDGTFGLGNEYRIPYSQTIAAGDLNRDGWLDLVSGNRIGPPLSVLLNRGDGTYAPPVTVNFFSAEPTSVLLADFGGDGRLDLVVASATGGLVGVTGGRGDGTFGGYRVSGSPGMWSPQALTVGDFDGNGQLDIVLGHRNTATVTVLVNYLSGGGSLATYTLPARAPWVAVADFDGDGNADLAATAARSVAVLPGDGAGTFPKVPAYNLDGAPGALAGADFNGDGWTDLVATLPDANALSVLLSNADGTFGRPAQYLAGLQPAAVVVADVNGDGLLDLLTANLGRAPAFDGAVGVLLGRGDGTFRLPRFYEVASQANALTVGDFDADGILDVAVVSFGDSGSSGTLTVLRGLGDGSFEIAATYATGRLPSAVLAADLNNDGLLDLAVSSRSDSDVQVRLGNGDGTFGEARVLLVGPGPSALGALDMNDDGAIDLITTNPGNSTLSVLPGNGDGTFGPAFHYATGTPVFELVVGDVDGDGLADLLGRTTDGAKVLLGRDGRTTGNYLAGMTPRALLLTDVDSDGRLDLVVANNGSRNVSVLLNEGGGGLAPNPNRPAPDAVAAAVWALAAGSVFRAAPLSPVADPASAAPLGSVTHAGAPQAQRNSLLTDRALVPTVPRDSGTCKATLDAGLIVLSDMLQVR